MIADDRNLSRVLLEGQPVAVGERYLSCHLFPNLNIIVPVQHIAEVMTIPMEQVTPMSHMSAWVMGVHNWRGEALWMVDLGHLLGFVPWYNQSISGSSHSVLVLQNGLDAGISGGNKYLGVVVTKVQDIKILDPNAIRAPSVALTNPALAPFLLGYYLDAQGEMLACIDVEATFSMISK
jgi:positive phototaxis protein PixI